MVTVCVMHSHWWSGHGATWVTVLTATVCGVVLGIVISTFGATGFLYAACGALVAAGVAGVLTFRQPRATPNVVKPRPAGDWIHH